MLLRCYSESFHRRQPTYIGCEVCDEWKYFMTFRAWMIKQEWENMQLDKDLLGEKLYSPTTCCFIPQWLNNLFTDRKRFRGKYPLGASFYKKNGKFISVISLNSRQKTLGYFETADEAHTAYKDAKLKHIKELMGDYPNKTVKQAVLEKARLAYGGPL